MQIIELEAEEAKKLIDSGAKCYLVLAHDLEEDIPLGKKRINRSKGSILIMNSKTIVLNQDDTDDESFSILSLYSALQKDIYNIQPKGVKHDMILFSPYKFV